MVGRRTAKIILRPAYFSLPANGSTCTELINNVVAGTPDIVITVVGDRCRRRIEAALISTTICLMFAGQGLHVELLPRSPSSFVIGAPPLSALGGVALLLGRMSWHSAAVLTQEEPTAGELAALETAGVSMPPIVLDLGDSADTAFGVCSEDLRSEMHAALVRVQRRYTPMIVVDV